MASLPPTWIPLPPGRRGASGGIRVLGARARARRLAAGLGAILTAASAAVLAGGLSPLTASAAGCDSPANVTMQGSKANARFEVNLGVPAGCSDSVSYIVKYDLEGRG